MDTKSSSVDNYLTLVSSFVATDLSLFSLLPTPPPYPTISFAFSPLLPPPLVPSAGPRQHVKEQSNAAVMASSLDTASTVTWRAEQQVRFKHRRLADILYCVLCLTHEYTETTVICLTRMFKSILESLAVTWKYNKHICCVSVTWENNTCMSLHYDGWESSANQNIKPYIY